MNDSLGDRMKQNYEDRARMFLPRRTYTIIRVDGKAFHTFTRGMKRPFDEDLTHWMNETAKALCKQIQGAKLAYVQSDEISIVLTDFDGQQTQAWFDGNIQKMASVSAAIATQAFNNAFLKYCLTGTEDEQRIHVSAILADCWKQAQFDSRVFTIPDPLEVENYLIWRQQDATRNSIQMAARAHFSHSECDSKDINKLQDLLMTKNINWNDYDAGHKRGRCVIKEYYSTPIAHVGKDGVKQNGSSVLRTRWTVVAPPVFTQDRNFIRNEIPALQPPAIISVNELNND